MKERLFGRKETIASARRVNKPINTKRAPSFVRMHFPPTSRAVACI